MFRMFRDSEYRVQPCTAHGWKAADFTRPVYKLHEADMSLLQCVLSGAAAWPENELATKFLDQIYAELARRA